VTGAPESPPAGRAGGFVGYNDTVETGTGERRRPGPFRWLWYAIGGGLPARNSEWVLYDTTCSTWIVRHLIRTFVLLALPVTAVATLLPASTGLRLLISLTAGACGLMFQVVHIIETTERRVIRAGYPAGTAEATRHQRSIDSQRAANERRRVRNAARQGRG
jgi:hypothetical protein